MICSIVSQQRRGRRRRVLTVIVLLPTASQHSNIAAGLSLVARRTLTRQGRVGVHTMQNILASGRTVTLVRCASRCLLSGP